MHLLESMYLQGMSSFSLLLTPAIPGRTVVEAKVGGRRVVPNHTTYIGIMIHVVPQVERPQTACVLSQTLASVVAI